MMDVYCYSSYRPPALILRKVAQSYKFGAQYGYHKTEEILAYSSCGVGLL